MEFDQSLMKQAVAYQAMSQPAPRSPGPHPVAPPTVTSAPVSRATANQAQTQLPATAQLTHEASVQQQPPGASVPAPVTRGRHKRARSPSSDHVLSQQQPGNQSLSGMSPAQARLQPPNAQAPAVQPQWSPHPQLHTRQQQQQQQQQQQAMSGGLPVGAVPLVAHHGGYQPLQANPAPVPSPSRYSPKAPSLHQKPQQQPIQQQQQSPQLLPMRPRPQGKIGQQGQPKASSSGAGPGHVDGMTHEEIVAAAAAAAAASGYGEPDKAFCLAPGHASSAGTRVQVSMPLHSLHAFRMPCPTSLDRFTFVN